MEVLLLMGETAIFAFMMRLKSQRYREQNLGDKTKRMEWAKGVEHRSGSAKHRSRRPKYWPNRAQRRGAIGHWSWLGGSPSGASLIVLTDLSKVLLSRDRSSLTAPAGIVQP